MNGFLDRLVAALNETRKTSETKALFVAALWAGAAKIIPGVPLVLPDLDLTAVGLGVLTVSPAMLVAYALVRVVIKVMTNGETPFLPSPKEEVPQ